MQYMLLCPSCKKQQKTAFIQQGHWQKHL